MDLMADRFTDPRNLSDHLLGHLTQFRVGPLNPFEFVFAEFFGIKKRFLSFAPKGSHPTRDLDSDEASLFC